MDQRLPYEQLIGAKLQNLSLPHMEDMIWARVKAQLDFDMPTDDNNGGDHEPQPPVVRGPLSRALPVIIIALISAFLYFKNKATITENTPSRPDITQPTHQPANQPTGPPPGHNITTTTPLMPQVTPTPVARLVDSSSLKPGLNLPAITVVDSGNSDKPASVFAQAQPPPFKIDTIPPQKKGKGVPGFKDNDYRIVPKKQEG